MTTFTFSLPDELLKQLADEAQNLEVSKNEILERALTLFLDEIKKARYAQSYKKASEENDIMLMAEEGLKDYHKNLKNLESF